MQKLFQEVKSLDKRCYEELYLSEDILMEQASMALAKEVRKYAQQKDTILFICGPGNNGADGITTARILTEEFNVLVYIPLGTKSAMAKLQLQRLEALHVKVVSSLIDSDVYVDAIFGSGLKRDLDEKIIEIIKEVNTRDACKIACDIPTGICDKGQISTVCFQADVTVTMGSLKESLYSDEAKDFVGKIKVANLGISRENYETKSNSYLLDKSDLELPYRKINKVNKGDFGHVAVIGGQKEGASLLAATAAFNFGAGLVSICGEKRTNLPLSIMNSESLPQTSNVVIAGMGLGSLYTDEKLRDFLLLHDKPLVIDADLLSHHITKEILEQKKDVVLTPHPKEFTSLLAVLEIANVTTAEVQKDRFKWAREFSKRYPNAVLVLKGANTIITQQDLLYVNSLGNSKLAKGGSGDVLAGMIGSLLAQGYIPIKAAYNASLAHALVAKKLKCSSFGLSPTDLCEGLKWL